jgi:hypothetical protein
MSPAVNGGSRRHSGREPDALDRWFARQRRGWWRRWWWLALLIVAAMFLASGYELVADLTAASHTGYRGVGGPPVWSGLALQYYKQSVGLCQLLQIMAVAAALLLQAHYFNFLLPGEDLLLALDERDLIPRLKARAALQPLLVMAGMLLAFHVLMYTAASWLAGGPAALAPLAWARGFLSRMTVAGLSPGLAAALANTLVCLAAARRTGQRWLIHLPAAAYVLYWAGLYSLHWFGPDSYDQVFARTIVWGADVVAPLCLLLMTAVWVYARTWQYPPRRPSRG